MYADKIVLAPHIAPRDRLLVKSQFGRKAGQDPLLNCGRIGDYDQAKEVIAIVLLGFLKEPFDFPLVVIAIRGDDYGSKFASFRDDLSVGGSGREFSLSQRDDSL